MVVRMTPWERFEASAHLEPVDFVQAYLPLRGETYRRGVEFNPLERYPEAIHFIGVGDGVSPALFGAELDERSVKAESDWWKLIIKSEEDYDKLELPDLRKALYPHLLESYKAALRRYPKESLERYGAWAVGVSGPLDLASRLRSYDMLLADVYRRPARVHRLFELITRANMEWIRLSCEALDRVKVVTLADHGLTFLSPSLVETFGLSYWCRHFGAAPKEAVRFYHNEGNVTHVLEAVPEMGAQVFNFGWVEAEEAKRRIGDRVCLCGNLSSVDLLLQRDVGEVVEACRSLIRIAAPGGGLILSSSGGMAPKTPLRNVDAIYETGMKYGRYPFRK